MICGRYASRCAGEPASSIRPPAEPQSRRTVHHQVAAEFLHHVMVASGPPKAAGAFLERPPRTDRVRQTLSSASGSSRRRSHDLAARVEIVLIANNR